MDRTQCHTGARSMTLLSQAVCPASPCSTATGVVPVIVRCRLLLVRRVFPHRRPNRVAHLIPRALKLRRRLDTPNPGRGPQQPGTHRHHVDAAVSRPHQRCPRRRPSHHGSGLTFPVNTTDRPKRIPTALLGVFTFSVPVENWRGLNGTVISPGRPNPEGLSFGVGSSRN